MKKLLYGAILCCSTVVVAKAQSEDNAGSGNLKYIDPRIGNVGALLQPTRPTVQLPNQVIRMYPERDDYIDNQIASFPLTIVSHRLGEVFSMKPVVSAPEPKLWRQKQTWDHDLEVTRPWYYKTYLIDDGITVEFAPANKAAIFRFTFPQNAVSKSLLFGQYNDAPGSYQITNGNTITGVETYHDNIKIYLYGQFSEAGKAGALRNQQLTDSAAIQGRNIGSSITFPAGGSNTVELRYAISFISAAQAMANFNEEIKGKQFDDVEKAAENTWGAVMNKIHIEGGTEAQRRSFFSAYYRCNERMVDITEDHQYFSGFDNKIHQTERPFYTDDWTWDTYLALHPLRAILNPEMEGDMVNSYVTMYQQGGWMPTFPVLFGDHACMNGFHSTVMILDDYRKGIRNFNTAQAYAGMYKNATKATMLPWRNGAKTVLDDFYYQKGYFPALHPGEKETVPQVHPFEKRQAVAVTLGASYDDWALGEFAKELGKDADYKAFNRRSRNYRNLWKNDAQMFFPKDSKGDWINIDPSSTAVWAVVITTTKTTAGPTCGRYNTI